MAVKQIKYPLPQIPRGVKDPVVVNYLGILRRAVEANLNALFATEPVNGEKLVPESVDEDKLGFSINSAIDFDIPLMEGIAWSAPGGVPTWTAGTIYYGGTSYTIEAGNAADNTYVAVYWPGADATHFGTTTTPTSVSGRWYMAFKVAGASTDIYPALQSTIIHGGLIQAQTVAAAQIVSNTITTAQLNFTPLVSSGTTTQIIATINASAEGIRIDADNINITGSTTFASGYDPTSKVAALAGTYNSAASGARVRIFPDSSTGIVVLDDAAAEVFKVLVGGTDVGDVIIGNFAGNKGLKWDKSAGTFTVRGSLVANDVTAGTFTLFDGSTLPFGSGSVNFAGGAFTCDTLVAKKSVTIGEDDGDNTFRILATAAGVITAICKQKYGSYYYKYSLNKYGIQAFYKDGSYPDETVNTNRTAALCPIGAVSLFSEIYAGRGYCTDATATSYHFKVTGDSGRFGVSGGARTITYDASGLVTVPSESLTGGTRGFSGSFVTGDSKTGTVINGIITNVA